ncbi:MAG TPA: hypothetical protein VIS78_10960 [Blastocatellia bacterium]
MKGSSRRATLPFAAANNYNDIEDEQAGWRRGRSPSSGAVFTN